MHDAGVDLIAPECAIPLQTKLENLLEIPKAVKTGPVSTPATRRRTEAAGRPQGNCRSRKKQCSSKCSDLGVPAP